MTTCKYHAFQIFKDSPRVIAEVCALCGKKIIFNKSPSGRIDNKKYLRLHVRDFCQPFGPTRNIYEEVYGRATLKKRREMLRDRGKSTQENIEEGAKSALYALKLWDRLKTKGYSEREIEKFISE